MRIYLDNNASSEIHPDVLAALEQAQRTCWANPSSVHSEGRKARRLLEESREELAAAVGIGARDLVFTSGGSEANNAAILGSNLSPGSHVVSTSIEHPSVLAALKELERRGHRVTLVPPTSEGVVTRQAVTEALREDTTFVAMMFANNETGVLQPVAEVAAECRGRGIHLHCDAVQAFGRMPLSLEALGVDSASIAAHKSHGPKGIGGLYVRQGVVLEPIVRGGAQERRRRAGTENAALAAAFAATARLPLAIEQVAHMRDRLEKEVTDGLETTINGGGAPRLPNTTSIRFDGSDAESLVIALDLEGVAASTGSACSSGRVEPSHVLIAMGLSLLDARSSVRFSLGKLTTPAHVDRAVEIVRAVVKRQAQRTAT